MLTAVILHGENVFWSNLKHLLMFCRIFIGLSSLNMTVKSILFLKITQYSNVRCHVITINDILAKNMSYKSKKINE